MSVKRILMGTLLVMMIVGPVSIAQGAETPPPEAYVQTPAKHWHDTDSEGWKKFHNPAEGVELGLDLRLREVYGRNILTLNETFGDVPGPGIQAGNWNNYHWQRYRTRLSAQFHLSDDVDFNTRLVWEFWTHPAPDRHHPGVSDEFFGRQSTELDEVIFDHFNLRFRNVFDMPLTLTVGRQDIILGTGWLVLDGTPGDGSRTIFFDAIRGTYDFSESTKLDLIYIQQYDDEEKYIKPFNHHAVQNRRRLTQKGDERGFIAYLTHKADSGQQQELYYMYKNDEDSDWRQHYQPTAAPGQNADIHTIGGRLAGPLNDNWSYSAELAKQFGDRNGRTLQALGANTKLAYAFHNDIQSEFSIGYEYMSGDDPDSSADERFDSLWGDWPQYQRGGDLQSYMWAFEGDGLGNVMNMHRVGFGYSFKPGESWTMLTQYNLLWADENTLAAGAYGPSGGLNIDGGDNFRGQMLTGLLTYQCCKKFKTEFLVDYFIPGNYYASPSGDDALFARVNMEWTF